MLMESGDKIKDFLSWQIGLEGRELFPLRKRVIGNRDSKKPDCDSWTAEPALALEEALAVLKSGAGLGCRLGDDDLVIDIDLPSAQRPGKQGAESLEKLNTLFGFDLLKDSGGLVVKSPKGGYHVYLRKPPELKLKKNDKRFPGVEFLSKGHYVVFPCSPHWLGGCYEPQNDVDVVPVLPVDVLEKLPLKEEFAFEENGTGGDWSPELLETALSGLDVTEFDGNRYDEWFRVMAASHHATGGSREALEVFLAWSAGDHRYNTQAHQEQICESWRKLSSSRERKVTAGSLLKLLWDRDQTEIISRVTSRLDFKPVTDSERAAILGESYVPVHRMTVIDQDETIAEKPALIDRICRRQDVVNIVAAPKVGKSWLLLGLAMTLGQGRKWFNEFQTAKTRVLYIDCELDLGTIKNRARLVANSMLAFDGDPLENVDVMPLRYRFDVRSIEAIIGVIRRQKLTGYGAIVIDPLYKLLAGREENSNSDVAGLYDLLLELSLETGATIFVTHHTSKGDQSKKANTDVGAGAGSQSRAADVHISLRPHLLEGKFVLASDLRTFTEIDSMTVYREGGVWRSAPDVAAVLADPMKKARQDRAASARDLESQQLLDLLRELDQKGQKTFCASELAVPFSIAAKVSPDPKKTKRLLETLAADGDLVAEELKSPKNGKITTYFRLV